MKTLTETSHPRLISVLQWQGILTTQEALNALSAHRRGDGRYGGPEAVVHYGGATKMIRDAFRNRRVVFYKNGGSYTRTLEKM